MAVIADMHLKVNASPAGTAGMQTATLQQTATTQPELGPDVSPLSLSVETMAPDILHVKIGAPGRWEVPRGIFAATNQASGKLLIATAFLVLSACMLFPTWPGVGRWMCNQSCIDENPSTPEMCAELNILRTSCPLPRM